jgi:hypothetical protein
VPKMWTQLPAEYTAAHAPHDKTSVHTSLAPKYP